MAREYEQRRGRAETPRLLFGAARRIGNLLAEFGDTVGAREWYESAIRHFREPEGRCSVLVAYMYWRMGEVDLMKRECELVVSEKLAVVSG
jgi:hypothetical protein